MANRFASGKWSIAMCDRCGQQFKLKTLKTEIIKQRKYELRVCSECWDPDHPQLMLGTFPVDDPQALRVSRRDTTYVTAGSNVLLNPTSGSRDIQWGWNPVGGSSYFDAPLTPNYLVCQTAIGRVTTNGFDVEPLITTLNTPTILLYTENTVTPFTPVSGYGGYGALTYSISPALPVNLSFSTSTGAISGSPAATQAAVAYTVTVSDTIFQQSSKSFYLAVGATQPQGVFIADPRINGYQSGIVGYPDTTSMNATGAGPAAVVWPPNSDGFSNAIAAAVTAGTIYRGMVMYGDTAPDLWKEFGIVDQFPVSSTSPYAMTVTFSAGNPNGLETTLHSGLVFQDPSAPWTGLIHMQDMTVMCGWSSISIDGTLSFLNNAGRNLTSALESHPEVHGWGAVYGDVYQGERPATPPPFVRLGYPVLWDFFSYWHPMTGGHSRLVYVLYKGDFPGGEYKLYSGIKGTP